MFSKILIANRGEIACRIIKTARRLGIATAAVYSDADRDAMHAELADEALHIGPAPARESYLDGGKILAAAKRCGAQAIHPGYGFVAENAEFADACAKAGIVFIGPPAAAIQAMGDKAEAKALMEEARVPLLPGYHGGEQDEGFLAGQAERIGYPIMVKPAAGGGGKGMKIAQSPGDFGREFASAKREALSAFGDARVMLEKFLPRARHVEVQIFADGEGNFIHLCDRDCSIQRRHQKIIEEAPAPDLTDNLRLAMREAALAAARAIHYMGAGTVEFLYSPDDEAFYFLEMNTRLQVEHPVTEMILGLDLVEWQIRVASGCGLPLRQEEIKAEGHAIEARLYAEDPARGFLPQAGKLVRLDLPARGPHVRIDAGVRSNDVIPVEYDPMIAKVIVWGKDRGEAADELWATLGEIRIGGPKTNLALLRAIVAHQAFRAGAPDTSFIERQGAELFREAEPGGADIAALAALGLLCERAAGARQESRQSQDPWSPWSGQSGWRLNGEAQETLRLGEIAREGTIARPVEVTYLRGGFRLAWPEGIFSRAEATLGTDGTLAADLDGHRTKASWLRCGEEVAVFTPAGGQYRFVFTSGPEAGAVRGDQVPGRITAPMPGRIVALLVSPGVRVEANQPLMVLEAMKMEHLLRAPRAGLLHAFKFKLGDQVAEGAELAILEAEPPEVAS